MKYLLPFILMITLSSCNVDLVFSEKVEILDSSWTYDNPISYTFDISDTIQTYDIVLKIEHDVEFSNQNFYTQFTTTYPNGTEIQDVVSMELSSKYGQWLGDCNSENCDIDILLKGRTRFRQLGNHTISIAQHTRNAVLDGVRSLEFNLIKVD